MSPARLTGCTLNPQQVTSLLGRIRRGQAWECWPWQGAVAPNGYGCIVWKAAGRNVRYTPHRLAFEFWTGHPIAPDLEIDHTCGNRLCCNPAHLERVTHQQNMARMHTRRRRAAIEAQRRLTHLAAIHGETL